MEKQIIARINGTEIFAETNEEGIFVPIKPICTTLGIDDKTQRDKIQEDEFLGSVGGIIPSTGSDGKTYEMYALPLQYIYGWLATINPGKVAPEAKEMVMKYRKECYDVLYDHFTGSMRRTLETNKAEIELLQKMNEAIEDEKEAKARIKNFKSQLEALRSERLNPQPSLFD